MEDEYFHKTVTLRAGDRRLSLATSQELFSSHQVDRGTRLLLRTIASHLGTSIAGAQVLDVGCGYGPLGLGLRALEASSALLVDRDALAVRYALANAAANGLDGVTAQGSVAYSDVMGTFDVVVANIPGHASEAVVAAFVHGAFAHLNSTGTVGLVAVNPLEPIVNRALPAEPLAFTQDRDYSVWIAGATAIDHTHDRGLALYERGRVTIEAGGRSWSVASAVGVPEFERLSHSTHALIDALSSLPGVERPLIWNPGAGHLPVWLALRFGTAAFTFVDRDLLALRLSMQNLEMNAPTASAEIRHDTAAAPADEHDVYIDVSRRSEPLAATSHRFLNGLESLPTGGRAVIAIRSGRLAALRAELKTHGVSSRATGHRSAAVLSATK